MADRGSHWIPCTVLCTGAVTLMCHVGKCRFLLRGLCGK